MTIEIEAVYENGVLKPDQPLPLREKQRVKVVIGEKTSRIRQSYGLMGWKGDPQMVEMIALDPEFHILESP